MAIDAVGAHIQRAVLEPADVEILRVVGNVHHFGERLDPVDATGLLGPEALRIAERPRVHLLVPRLRHMRARPPFFGNRKYLVGHWGTPITLFRRYVFLPRAQAWGRGTAKRWRGSETHRAPIAPSAAARHLPRSRSARGEGTLLACVA